jgi:regulator of nucleoside diphosphate kinase
LFLVDEERLLKLLESLPNNAFPGKADLETELARAEVVDPQQIPANVVTMNSTVRFRLDATGEEFCLTLVYPNDHGASRATPENESLLAPDRSLPPTPSRGEGGKRALRDFHSKDLDPNGGDISILAPVGSALLGLAKGDEIEWPRPGGGQLRLRIEEVIYQPEREGAYYR